MPEQARRKNLDEYLNHFTGTECYHRHFTGGRYTDGIQALAEKYEAYWLLDVVFSHAVPLTLTKPDDAAFMACKLVVDDETDKAVFTVENGNGKELARQEIPFTDFPALEQTIWVVDGIALLPSEY